MPFKKNNFRKTQKQLDGTLKPIDHQFVKVYFMGGGDFTIADHFPPQNLQEPDQKLEIPRYFCGAFVVGFKALYKAYHGYEPEIFEYGKPHLKHMKFSQQMCLDKCPDV